MLNRKKLLLRTVYRLNKKNLLSSKTKKMPLFIRAGQKVFFFLHVEVREVASRMDIDVGWLMNGCVMPEERG